MEVEGVRKNDEVAKGNNKASQVPIVPPSFLPQTYE